MRRLFLWWCVVVVVLWTMWSGLVTRVIHPIRTYDVIDSIKIQMPRVP